VLLVDAGLTANAYAAVLMRYLTNCTQSCDCAPMIWFWAPQSRSGSPRRRFDRRRRRFAGVVRHCRRSVAGWRKNAGKKKFVQALTEQQRCASEEVGSSVSARR